MGKDIDFFEPGTGWSPEPEPGPVMLSIYPIFGQVFDKHDTIIIGHLNLWEALPVPPLIIQPHMGGWGGVSGPHFDLSLSLVSKENC